LRLLVVCQYFWPEDFRVNELVGALARRGHDITILTGKPNYPHGRLFPEFVEHPERFATYEGARIIRVPIVTRGRGSLRLFINFLSYAISATLLGPVRLRGQRFDAIFVCQLSPVTMGIPAVALRRLKRCPLAFWVLDEWPEALAVAGPVRSKAVLRPVGLVVAFIYARCDLILAPSRSLARRIQRYANGHARIGYFPNWVEDVYRDAAPAPAPEMPLLRDSFNVMFAGNVGEAQDFPAILDAAERLADHQRIRWLIVGDGRMASWVAAEVVRRGLQERVLLLGRFPPERMASLYMHASALLVSLKSDPILSAAIPGKIQSYMGFGLPVIGMLDGEGAAVIEEASAGLTCPAGDSAQLADVVLRMAAMPEGERAAMGVNGRTYARREFDRDVLIGQLEEWLKGLSTASP
jgi:colanic acid biosynthesis glycosyl transferase WcaI